MNGIQLTGMAIGGVALGLGVGAVASPKVERGMSTSDIGLATAGGIVGGAIGGGGANMMSWSWEPRPGVITSGAVALGGGVVAAVLAANLLGSKAPSRG